ncbi:glycoside hydrolase family 13 protein [Aliiglaciecola sp. CAU 1673]|uniref:glycoside hydrolase family 13 protein n=1 Tax=Aliiglaciecola sp. CAU 1673 TaxID=3032595 RepID=UPI0023DC5BFA|nr:glycoside hydrolase family 13 protein [Aliiglaciecola sp. CAU 1673]MDF2179030.1 glycoside hydrolase family 13 protein [Aliiglaciecola sp. CAU 1673]
MRSSIALFLVVLSLLSTRLSASSIEHLEPLHWWVGMQSPKLQLMVHGEDIAGLTPKLTYPGVSIEQVHRVENPNYLFIDLNIAPETKSGVLSLGFYQEDTLKLSQPYQLKARQPGSAMRQGFGPADSIYLITPDRFANGDPTNDNVAGYQDRLNRNEPDGRHGGDIRGIIEHLDYLQALGVTQLWINPLLDNAMDRTSYHGYSTTDYYAIDPRFGSHQDYLQLSEKARAKGMGLIKDVILNHIGSQHWWMADLPSQDWLNHVDRYQETNHRREALHDPHGTQTDRLGFSDGWFVPTMPDLNQRHPFVANYLIQNSIWWVEEATLSGIRLDTYSYSDKEFLSQYTERLMVEYPKLGMVGEEWSMNPAIVAYWQRGTARHDDYQSALPSLFDFPLQVAVVEGLKNPETWALGLRQIYQVLANDFVYGDPYALVIMPDNHDMSRIFTQLNEDPALWKMAMVLFATTRGTPQFFYGTEILMSHPGTDAHGAIRTDFPGGWPGDKVNAFSGKGLTTAQQDAQAFMRKLLNWRKTASAVHSGKLTHFAPSDGHYVYFRHTDKQMVMVVLNKDDKPLNFAPQRYAEVLGERRKGRDVLSGQAVDLQALSVAPKSAIIIDLSAE